MTKRFVFLLLLVALMALAVSAATTQDEAVSVEVGLDHPYAAFLESRSFAASLGATAEFRKMEWVAIDAINNKLYLAMSDINRGMSDGEGDINVDENLCGIVYEADLDESYNMTELRPLIIGGPYNPDGGANRCDVNNIANPDAVRVDGMGRLWIGEDTGNHENNMIWVYNPADGSLKRFGYTPLGAEVTGLFPAANGTLFANSQHPDATNIFPYNSAHNGYVAGFDVNNDDFEEIPVPEGDAKRMYGVAAGEYHVLGRVGDPIPGSGFGYGYGEVRDVNGEHMFYCNGSDGNMWLPSTDDGLEGILYTNYECRPGSLSRLNIRKLEDGTYEVLEGEMVDFSSVNGTWNNCGAGTTPWNTAFTSEEYEPFANDLGNVRDLTAYLGRQANPYDYGYMVELEPATSTYDRINKRFALGRKSNENAEVAPDLKTVYFGDDGTDVVLFKFVAEVEGDLSAGTLYAAAVTQQGGTGDDHYFELEWIELGYGFDDDIEAAVREIDAQLEQ